MKHPNCFCVLRTSTLKLYISNWWPIRTNLVKLVTQISGVFKMLRWFPATVYVVVTGTLDEIMQLAIARPRVEYVVDFPFLCFHNYDQVRLWRLLTSDWQCIMIRKQLTDNIAVPHRCWQVKFDRMLVDDLTYRIQSCVLIIELLWRSRCFQVPGW